MNWTTVAYRLPPEHALKTCERQGCTERSTCGFTSINEYGDRRCKVFCDACTVTTAEKCGIKPPGLREAIIFPIPVSADVARCASCKAEVRWIYTAKGKRMPADPNGISHFLSCPGASTHRKHA